jgi:hypothetical protein
MTIEAVRRLTRSEKLRLMEELWIELSQPDSEYESPAWHAQVLAETEKRVAEGKEAVMEWESAKKQLRDRFK